MNEAELAHQGGSVEVSKMKRCKSCGELKNPEDLDGQYCGRCDKIQGDVMADLKAELCG